MHGVGIWLAALARQEFRLEDYLNLIMACPLACRLLISFVVQQVPQPWHPHSSYVHEAALAVKDVSPDSFPSAVDALYSAYTSGKFQDESTWDKSRAQIYEELVKELPASVDAAAVAAKLTLKEGGGGTHMTQAIKWACKYHRGRGVHVTPTVHVNGLEAGVISSGWTAEQWLKFIEPMGEDNWTGSKLS